MTKKQRVIALAVAVVGLSTAAIVLYRKTAHTTITAYDSIAAANLSESEYQELFRMHASCFDPDMERNLYRYLRTTDDRLSSLPSTELKQRINTFVSEHRKSRFASFKQSQHVRLMRDRGRIVGMYSCVPEDLGVPQAMMIYNVCVAADRRGQGLGTILMQDAIAQCQRPGFKLTLLVYADDERVIRLYQRLGFDIVDPLPLPLPDDFHYYNRYVMEYHGPKEDNP